MERVILNGTHIEAYKLLYKYAVGRGAIPLHAA
jgi:hypothetical protein